MKNSAIALGSRNRLAVMGRKQGTGLTEEQAKHLAEELRPYLERFDDNATRMAKAWGVAQSQMSQILSGRGRGAGVAVLIRLRQATGRSLDELLGLKPLGPSIDDRIRSAVDDALDRALEGRAAEMPAPAPPLPPPVRRRRHES